MARKVTVSKTNTMDAWRQKVNQMSNYMEDLDNLDSYYTVPPFSQIDDSTPYGFTTGQDSTFVSALNSLAYYDDYLNRLLWNPVLPHDTDKLIIGKINANLLVDSGYIQKLHVDQLWNYDSALTGPRNGDSDYLWYEDSPGTAAFDFIADSVHINTLYVVNADFIDSAQIYDRLTVNEWTQDTGDDLGFVSEVATFNEFVDINTLHMDSQVVHIVRPFYINPPSGVKASAHWASYLMDSEDGHTATINPDFSLS